MIPTFDPSLIFLEIVLAAVVLVWIAWPDNDPPGAP